MGPRSWNVVTYHVVQLAMSLSAAIYTDFRDPDYNFSGTLLFSSPSPATEDQVEFWVYNETIENRKSLFIVIRGSSTELDFGGNLQVPELSFNGTFFHEGFFRAGTWLLDLVSKNISTWCGDVFFVGHSRGGAVSATAHTLATFLYPKHTNFRSLCFAPPPSVANLGAFVELDIYDHMFSFVYGRDPIPRFTIAKVDSDFRSPTTGRELVGNISSRLGIALLHPFGRHLLAAVRKKQDQLIATLHQYQNDSSQFHITEPLGRVYWLRDKTLDLSSSRITTNVSGKLGKLGFTFPNIMQHHEHFYSHWIRHMTNGSGNPISEDYEWESSVNESYECEPTDMRITRAFLGIRNPRGRIWTFLARFTNSSRFYDTSVWLGSDRRVGVIVNCNLSSRAMTVGEFSFGLSEFGVRELRVTNPMKVSELVHRLNLESIWLRNIVQCLTPESQRLATRIVCHLGLKIDEENFGDRREIPSLLMNDLEDFTDHNSSTSSSDVNEVGRGEI
jgi:hypothetical protein